MVDGESDASVGVGVENDASVNNAGSCASAGGACMGVLTCTVVGPVHCGPNSLCCLVTNMNTMVVSDDAATGTGTPNACATSNCSDAGSASASGDAAAD